MARGLRLPLLLVLAWLTIANARATELRGGLEISKSRTFQAGEVRLDAPIRITGDDLVVDFGGAVLLGPNSSSPPDRFTGTGIEIVGRKNVTIRNVILRGFKVGIHARDCEKLTVRGCEVTRNFRQHLRSTLEREATQDWLWPHYNDNNEWIERYGASIYLEGCRDSTLAENRGRDSQNGILLSRTESTWIYDNDFSYQSGWGLALWRSSRNHVTRNRFDYCVRGYSHGVYHRGQDSTGILVFEQCHRNVFAYNSATHGGDGFFLYAGHETLKSTGEGGCNENFVFGNDFSHAVANGIEATFSRGNRFVNNVLDECDYGVWAGYSYDSEFVGNKITRSLTAGIAIEHGNGNRIQGNTLENNRRGIWLWWDYDKEFLEGVYGKHRNTDSESYEIRGNRFLSNGVGLELGTTKDVLVESNEFTDHEVVFRVKGECAEIDVRSNNLFANRGVVETGRTAPSASGTTSSPRRHRRRSPRTRAGASFPGNRSPSRPHPTSRLPRCAGR